MDILDKKFKIKRFLKTIYRDLEEGEEIRTLAIGKDNSYSKVKYFKDIDDLVQYSTSKAVYNQNTYFELPTTDGQGGKLENLKYRHCLAFDFDKKDYEEGFNHKDIINLFKSIGIHYHALVDSGNGYHCYILINKTDNLTMVQAVQNALCKKLKADSNACKPTQLLRIPMTFNVKNERKMVNIIKLDDRNSELFKPYDIEFLYNKNCMNVCVGDKSTNKDDRTTKFVLNNTRIPQCIENILSKGTLEGDRYKDLCNIVVALRQRNKPLSSIKEVCKEWSIKSNYNDNLEYRIEHIYNNKHSLELNCKECEQFKECYDRIVSDFEFDSNYGVFILEDKISKALKNSNRRGAKVMNGNELLLVNVLKNNDDGLFTSEIVKKITYKKKCRLSKPTYTKTLNSLVDKGIITVVKGNSRKGEENFYKINPIKCKEDNKINVSYLATSMCICRLISPTELQLYHLMRYLHHEQQIKQPNALKGNLFQINQSDLSKRFYGSDKAENQSNISKMINNLLECHILDIWERGQSKNNNFEYYIYRLNS